MRPAIPRLFVFRAAGAKRASLRDRIRPAFCCLSHGSQTYVMIKIISGKAQDCSAASYVIAMIFALKYIFL